jgi:hypothetical protein
MVPAWCPRKKLVVICDSNALSSFYARIAFANDERVHQARNILPALLVIRLDND